MYNVLWFKSIKLECQWWHGLSKRLEEYICTHFKLAVKAMSRVADQDLLSMLAADLQDLEKLIQCGSMYYVAV